MPLSNATPRKTWGVVRMLSAKHTRDPPVVIRTTGRNSHNTVKRRDQRHTSPPGLRPGPGAQAFSNRRRLILQVIARATCVFVPYTPHCSINVNEFLCQRKCLEMLMGSQPHPTSEPFKVSFNADRPINAPEQSSTACDEAQFVLGRVRLPCRRNAGIN